MRRDDDVCRRLTTMAWREIGALVYYIRRCLHDYGDKDAVDILQQISGAMASDSRLLIVEQVMSDPPTPFSAATNIFIGNLGGKERTLDGFHAIASAAGLKIAKVWSNPGTEAAIIECVKL